MAQGRGHMAQRDGSDAAFGLCGFAGVIDDERIDDGQRANQCLGPACVGQGHRFAGKPFQRAMGTDMDQRIGSGLQPEVKGDIGMAG